MFEHVRTILGVAAVVLAATFAQEAAAGAISSGGVHDDVELPSAKEVGNGVTDEPLRGVDFGNGVVGDAGWRS